jgi:hypothetical protein
MLNLFLPLFLFLFFPLSCCLAADNCLNCHTKPGELIKITRNLEKPGIEQSSETKGEG